MNSPQQISVIVAARNSAATIRKCLSSLVAQDHDSFEIIVVDDGSTDDTTSICESYESVRVIKLLWGGPSRARNVAVKAANGDIVVFTDSDCVARPNLLKELAKCFSDPEVAGAGGDQTSPEDETPMGRRIQEFFKTIGFMTGYIKPDAIGRDIRETTHNPSCNSAYRRAIFEEVGGFCEDQFPEEDVELDLKLRRLGHKLVYNPAAVVGHYRPSNLRAFVSMMKRYGAGERRLVRKYGLLRRLDFLPFALILGIAGFLWGIIWYPAVWPLFFAPWLAGWGFLFLKTHNASKSLQFALFLTLAVVGWNWGFIMGDGRRGHMAFLCAEPETTAWPNSSKSRTKVPPSSRQDSGK